MAEQYMVLELKELKDFPDFQENLKKLKDTAIKKASGIWQNYTFGGMFPTDMQFGMTTVLPKFLEGFAATTMTTFRQNFTSTGWQTIFNKTLDEDILLAGMGFAITSPTVNLSEIRMEISDVKYPRINIEELQSYTQPAILLKQGFICPEEKKFYVRGYFESTGYQRIVPIGSFVLFKKKDDVINE